MLVSLPALLQEGASAKVKKALDHYAHEPGCGEVVKKVLKEAEKDRKVKIPSTKCIRASALLPVFRFSITKNLEYDESLSLLKDDDSTLKIYTDDDLKLKFTFQWDLSSLVFSSSETPVIAKEQSEAKWKLEIKTMVVEIYHMRKKLQVLLHVMSDSLPVETCVEWSLKLEELTALLDSLTGNWFSKEIKKRKKKKSL